MDDLVDLVHNVDGLVELDLDIVVEVVQELVGCEGQWLLGAVCQGTADAGLGAVDGLGQSIGGALGNADSVAAVVAIGADEAVLGGDGAGLANRGAVQACSQAEVHSGWTGRDASDGSVVPPQGRAV